MKRYLVVTFLFFISLFLIAEPLTVLTEEFPPYNFLEDGELTGVSYDVVKKFLEEYNYSFDIKDLPWTRAYNQTLSEKNTLLFSTNRNEAREDLFYWIGPIVPREYVVLALALRNFTINDLDDLREYKIGVTQSDAREIFFLQHDFIPGEEVVSLSGIDSNVRNFKKLLSGRIDFWPMDLAVAKYLLSEEGYDFDTSIQIVYELDEIAGDGYYIAANIQTDLEIIQLMQQQFVDFKNSDKYKTILAEWGF